MDDAPLIPLVKVLGVAFGVAILFGWLSDRRARKAIERRRQGEVLAARWRVIEAAEHVLAVVDFHRMEMPHELHGAVERLREAVVRERRA